MSRRSRPRRHQQAAAPQASVDNPPSGTFPGVSPYGGAGGLTGYESAQATQGSGYIYWPTLDPLKESTPLTRVETARKIHYFCANLGLARRVLSGLANLVVGPGLRPQGLTKDTEWNRLAERSYHNRGSSPITYDANGCLTDTRAQRVLVLTAYKDADAAAVFTKSASGGAMRAFYSGLQVGNSTTTTLDQSRWLDGVQLSRGTTGPAIAYRFPGENGSVTDVPAGDMVFLARYESFGKRRGESILAHAVRRMTHVTEIDAAVTQNIKSSSSIGYYLSADAATPVALDMKQAAKQTPGRATTVVTPDEKAKVNLKVVFGNGNEIATLPPGYDIKTLLDQRPHQNSREFVFDSMITDIAYGAGVSPYLLWNIAKLGGANSRIVLSDAQTFVTVEQQWLVDYFLARDWVYHCACEMQAKRLRPCADPEWYYHGWIPPARQTADFSRDGAMYLKWYQAGMLTANRWFALNGQDAREETLQHYDFCAWARDERANRNLSLADVAPGLPGAPAPSDKTDEQPPEDEDEIPTDEVTGHPEDDGQEN